MSYFFIYLFIIFFMMTYYYSCSGKEKATEYYIANKEVLKENAKN